MLLPLTEEPQSASQLASNILYMWKQEVAALLTESSKWCQSLSTIDFSFRTHWAFHIVFGRLCCVCSKLTTLYFIKTDWQPSQTLTVVDIKIYKNKNNIIINDKIHICCNFHSWCNNLYSKWNHEVLLRLKTYEAAFYHSGLFLMIKVQSKLTTYQKAAL